MTSREKLTAVFEREWLTLAKAGRQDIIETYGSVRAFADLYDYDEAQLSRIFDGKANPPGWLLAKIIWRCKGRNLIRAECSLASGTYEPLPDPTEAEEALAMVRAAREKGAEGMLRAWANLPPRETP